MTIKKLSKEEKMKQEIKAWRETCEILSNEKIMRSIQKSLKQISEGKEIPLSRL